MVKMHISLVAKTYESYSEIEKKKKLHKNALKVTWGNTVCLWPHDCYSQSVRPSLSSHIPMMSCHDYFINLEGRCRQIYKNPPKISGQNIPHVLWDCRDNYTTIFQSYHNNECSHNLRVPLRKSGHNLHHE